MKNLTTNRFIQKSFDEPIDLFRGMKISTAKILFKYLRVNSGTMNKFIKFSVLFLFFGEN